MPTITMKLYTQIFSSLFYFIPFLFLSNACCFHYWFLCFIKYVKFLDYIEVWHSWNFFQEQLLALLAFSHSVLHLGKFKTKQHLSLENILNIIDFFFHYFPTDLVFNAPPHLVEHNTPSCSGFLWWLKNLNSLLASLKCGSHWKSKEWEIFWKRARLGTSIILDTIFISWVLFLWFWTLWNRLFPNGVLQSGKSSTSKKMSHDISSLGKFNFK